MLSPDWSALIGHNGHLNVHLMMRKMGWWKGSPVLLAYKERIANKTFLSLFEKLCPTLTLGENVPEGAWYELASLTPFIGDSHQAFEFQDGRTMYWNDAGAMALQQWEREGRGFPLRDVYDEKMRSTIAPRRSISRCGRNGEWLPAIGTSVSICAMLRRAARPSASVNRSEVRRSGITWRPSAISPGWADGSSEWRPQSAAAAGDAAGDRLCTQSRSGAGNGYPSGAAGADVHRNDLRLRLCRLELRHSDLDGECALLRRTAVVHGYPLCAQTRAHKGRANAVVERRHVGAMALGFPTYETVPSAGLVVGESSADEILETTKEVLDLSSGNKPQVCRSMMPGKNA